MAAFIFGDVHGELDKLTRILDQAANTAPQGLDLYSTGDLVDRGPQSKSVINLCIERGVQPVIGNHELWFRDLAIRKTFDSFALSRIMGGCATLKSYGIEADEDCIYNTDAIPSSHKEFLANAPLWRSIKVGGTVYRITHGGVPHRHGRYISDAMQMKGLMQDGFDGDLFIEVFAKTSTEILLWAGAKRDQVFKFPDGSIQVFGHTPWRPGAEVNADGGYIALDTGCGTCPPHTLSGVLLADDGGRTILTA